MLTDHQALVDCLSSDECLRAAVYLRDSDRQDFIAGHLLLKVLAGRALCLPARHVELFQQCPSCGGPHGRPSLPRQPRLQLALAHSEGVVLAAVGWGLLGVDVERRTAPTSPQLLDRFLTVPEQRRVLGREDAQEAAVRAWTRKEALLKARGQSLEQIREVDLSHLPLGRSSGVRTFRDRALKLTFTEWTDLALDASCCVVAGTDSSSRVRDFSSGSGRTTAYRQT